jgi:beta-barrel assembly-enhancing protease
VTNGAAGLSAFSLLTFLFAFLTLFTVTSACAAAAPGQSDSRYPTPALSRGIAAAKKAAKYDVQRIGQRPIGRGFNLYSLKHERVLGEELAAQLDRNTRPVNDDVVNGFINRLGHKIARNSDSQLQFTIKVIDSGDVPRAYGLPGGFLYVNSALILSADGEAELAGVMAHEIAHIAARHATRALTRQKLCNLTTSIALLTGPAAVVLEEASGIAGPLSVKNFSRNAEYEADLLGVEYAYAAGYDPEALLVALEKAHAIEIERTATLAKLPGYHLATKVPLHNQIAKELSNYPSTEQRINRLQLEIASFLPSRNDYILDTGDFEEVKARLLACNRTVLQHHSSETANHNEPVLRRGSD